ncbi:polar amino acid transport system permease protein [Rhizobium sp. BK650]|uniref:ABC transporter permease n=1 Tax=Rhizobium sp. BK650 TaxID=2586990 RepID=UPI0018469896|nr:ABC transporter permease subunit [Rhizobium sp. BK650]MBB3660053.1 polar amino acid transport system permease protein [Rhizobium sp. BK650]
MFDLELLSLTPPGWGATLVSGFVNSVLLAVGGYAVGLAIGVSGATGKLYGGSLLREILDDYTTVVRAVPELVLILLLYYAGTDAINRLLAWISAGSININGVAAGIAVIGIVQGAYSTEVIRAAILAIPAGQIEAARAFGMPSLMVLWRVILPAMLPFALPGLGNLWLVATKDTALLAVVGFNELTLATRQAAGSTKAYLLFFSAAALIYLALTMLSTSLFKLLEARASRGLMVTHG